MVDTALSHFLRADRLTMPAMRSLVAAALTVSFAVSCTDASLPATTRPAQSASATTLQTSAVPVVTATSAPTPTPVPIAEIACADLDGFLDRSRSARVTAAGPVSQPAPVPTVPPPDTTPPPLGQYVLAESPLYPFTQHSVSAFLRTNQDIFGPDVWGQSRELAIRNGLVWAYAQTFNAGISQPGGLLEYVHEFWSVEGALSFDESVTRNTCIYGGSVFEIPGVPGATGQRFRNGAQYALRATFVKGKRRYTVMLTTTALMPAEEIAYVARFAVNVAR
jgi:hypothetical protein